MDTPFFPEHIKLWTMPDCYAGEVWPGYYGSGCGQHRDSDALTRSNFTCMLKALGGESETVIVVHEGHWAVGWVEWIAIHQDDEKALRIADEIAGGLEDYPVVNEDHWSEVETEEAHQVWAGCYSPKERVEYIRRHRDQFEFHGFADPMAQVRGKYFGGYASEIIN
ncbi:hypothetical protein [Mesorhizobium sp. M0767]|uniref:hypothetical protein n=1 Tax=Mesorhizobium sp. M0767 TaxID=2956995 RepID=UPI00333E0703